MKNYSIKPQEIKLNDEYEVIIIGGGPAGCAAAIASGRKGAKTLLIEATTALGGMGTMGLIPGWCPFTDREKVIHKGIAEEILNESKKGVAHMKDKYDWVDIDHEYLKRVYDKMVTDAGCDVIFGATLCMVDVEEDEIKAIVVNTKSGLFAYKGKVYIDCTGDGDLATKAGAELLPLEEGEEAQPATHCFKITNVDDYGYTNNRFLPRVNPESPIHKMFDKYDLPDKHLCLAKAGPGMVNCNGGHIWDIDIDDPVSVSKSYIEGRKIANEFLKGFQEFLPETYGNARIAITAPLMGIRESRRVKGDYVLTFEDYMARKTFEDDICRNAYYIDVHYSKAEVDAMNSGKADFESKTYRYEKGEYHGIPYRCLTPKGFKNMLMAGRFISTDHAVQGSTRVMPVCLCMGEAVGKAAVIAKDMENIDVHNIDVKLLQKQIVEDGGLI